MGTVVVGAAAGAVIGMVALARITSFSIRGLFERILGPPAGTCGGAGLGGGPSGPTGAGSRGGVPSEAFEGGCGVTGSAIAGPFVGIGWYGPSPGIGKVRCAAC